MFIDFNFIYSNDSTLFSKHIFHRTCLTKSPCFCKSKKSFKSVQKKSTIKAFFVPNDPFFFDQNAHNQSINFGSLRLKEIAGNYLFQLKLHKAWEVTTGSEDIIIAVIDSGINPNHEDLSGKVVGGYNVISDSDEESAYNDPANLQSPLDSFHGTKVASIAAANTNNNIGIAGAGFNSKLYAIRNRTIDESPEPYSLELSINKIIELVNAGTNIKVICISSGFESLENVINEPVNLEDPLYLNLQTAINTVTALGVTVVAAAGNKDSNGTWDINSVTRKQFPACLDNVITVGGAAGTVYAENFSLYGDRVDVIAPYMITKAAYYDNGSYYTGLEVGTSFSAPMVAGIVALMYAYNSDLTPAMAEYALIHSAIDKGPIGYDIYNGHGFVDAFKALAYVDPILPSLNIENMESVYNIGDPIHFNIQVDDNFAKFLHLESNFSMSDLLKATLNYTQTLTDNSTIVAEPQAFFYQAHTQLFSSSIIQHHPNAASISYNIELCDLNPANHILVYGKSDIMLQDLQGPAVTFPLSTFVDFSNPIIIGLSDNVSVSLNSLELRIVQEDISETFQLSDNQSVLTYLAESEQLHVNLTANDALFQTLSSDKPLSMYIDVMDVSDNETNVFHTFEQRSQMAVMGADLSEQFFNSPNPFDPQQEPSSFCFELSQEAFVRIEIYSLYLGLVKTVFQGNLNVGYHRIDWNGRDTSGHMVPNGVYIAVLHAKKENKEIKKTCKVAVLRR